MSNPIRNRQLLTFAVSWIAYASTYLLRKPLGVIKSDLTSSHSLSKTDLGWLDTALLFPYAIMQMLLGNLGDKYGARKILAANLVMSALSMVTFGFWRSLYVMAFLLFANGAAQATCWPNCVRAISSWYTDEQKATIFGIWGTCTFAGGLMGTALAVQLQSRFAPDLRLVFLVPSIIVFAVGIIVYLFLYMPEELDMEIPGKDLQKTVIGKKVLSDKQLTFFQLWKVKMLPELAWTTFLMKLVRYCLYMWLPFYLFQNLGYSKVMAGALSTAFEIGGVAGSASLGFLMDRLLGHGKTHWGVVIALFGSTIALVLFQVTSRWGWLFNVTFMFIAGVCNCGPDAFVSGSIAAELGERENAQSAVSGFINGFGSVGTIMEGPIVGFIAEHYGWESTFYVMIVLSLMSVVTMLRAARLNDRLRQNVF
ncbi:uncharacterized protein LOC135692557 [Rhopilema esculentum]|uniref:uncharacterized protein LOC135692557 n=1 Tax=Rhopilema esculentum TaxID=499914 RepID=UPI0031E0EADC|eukprot:gene2086-17657_t